MPQRATRTWRSPKWNLCVLAAAFAGTAAVQTFLAASTSEWWPGVLAATLTAAAVWCLVTAFTTR